MFQRWGRVLDVFIARKLNARCRRFGFVRFHGVTDVLSPERKLDAIWIGTWKLQVNLPKYRRDDASRVGKKRGVVKREVWTPKGQQKLSFAQMVAGDVVLDVRGDADAGGSGKSACGSQEEGYDFQFPVDKESSSWLEGCFFGRLKESPRLQSIKESFILGGFSLVRLRFLGEKYVLLSCDEGEALGKVLEDNKAWLDNSCGVTIVLSVLDLWSGSLWKLMFQMRRGSC